MRSLYSKHSGNFALLAMDPAHIIGYLCQPQMVAPLVYYAMNNVDLLKRIMDRLIVDGILEIPVLLGTFYKD